MVRTCLGSLRKSLSAQDPQQHTIDQLEHAVASLVDLAMSSTSLRDPSPTLNRKHYSRSSKNVSNTSQMLLIVNIIKHDYYMSLLQDCIWETFALSSNSLLLPQFLGGYTKLNF